MMPEEVLRTAQSEMLDYHGKGLSVMEMSHRSKEYMEIAEQAEQDLRDLYNIPDNYKVLFLQGGGRGQFADVPMNLIKDQNNSADYIVTGAWSKYAYEEGLKYGKMRRIDGVKTVDGLTCWNDDYTISSDAQYVYYCMNETIHGIEHPELPKGQRARISSLTFHLMSLPESSTSPSSVLSSPEPRRTSDLPASSSSLSVKIFSAALFPSSERP